MKRWACIAATGFLVVGCAAQPPSRRWVPSVVSAPTDEVQLRGSLTEGWQLSNRTPVTIESAEHTGFCLWFERASFHDYWRPPPFEVEPITDHTAATLASGGTQTVPLCARPIHLEFPTGNWRALVSYRDPRHPLQPHRALQEFQVRGLTPAQCDSILQTIAQQENRDCLSFTAFAHDFARTAPLDRLSSLVELSTLTVAERAEALRAITNTTRDVTLLRASLDHLSSDLRRAAARATAGCVDRNDALSYRAERVLLQFLEESDEVEAKDVHALFALYPWNEDVLDRLLRRLTQPTAPAHLALTFMERSSQLQREELLRVRAVLQRAVSSARGATQRQGLRPILQAITEQLRPNAVAPVRPSEDAPPHSNAAQCSRIRAVLRPMEQLLEQRAHETHAILRMLAPDRSTNSATVSSRP